MRRLEEHRGALAPSLLKTLLGLKSRFGYTLLYLKKKKVGCPENGTAFLKGLSESKTCGSRCPIAAYMCTYVCSFIINGVDLLVCYFVPGIIPGDGVYYHAPLLSLNIRRNI